MYDHSFSSLLAQSLTLFFVPRGRKHGLWGGDRPSRCASPCALQRDDNFTR
jgi:hypothetical protein